MNVVIACFALLGVTKALTSPIKFFNDEFQAFISVLSPRGLNWLKAGLIIYFGVPSVAVFIWCLVVFQ